MTKLGKLLQSRELRFLVVGGLNTLMSLAIFTVLALLLEKYWDEFLIVTVASAISIVVNFTSQRFLVWQSRGKLWVEFLRYLVSSLVVYVLNIAMFWLFRNALHLGLIPAQYASMLLATVATYFALKYFAFAARTPKP